MGKLVPYYRVSTRKQGEYGLGLEAQQSCVINYARTGSHRFDYFQSELLPVLQDNDNPRPRHGPIGEGVDGAFTCMQGWF